MGVLYKIGPLRGHCAAVLINVAPEGTSCKAIARKLPRPGKLHA